MADRREAYKLTVRGRRAPECHHCTVVTALGCPDTVHEGGLRGCDGTGWKRNRVSNGGATMEFAHSSSSPKGTGMKRQRRDSLFVVEGAPCALSCVRQQLEWGAESGTYLLAREDCGVQ